MNDLASHRVPVQHERGGDCGHGEACPCDGVRGVHEDESDGQHGSQAERGDQRSGCWRERRAADPVDDLCQQSQQGHRAGCEPTVERTQWRGQLSGYRTGGQQPAAQQQAGPDRHRQAKRPAGAVSGLTARVHWTHSLESCEMSPRWGVVRSNGHWPASASIRSVRSQVKSGSLRPK